MRTIEKQGHKITILGEVEDGVMEQAMGCLTPEEGSVAVINGDNHVGYSQPVGVGVGYERYISVSGVGYDIGCGNKAVLTNLKVEDIGDLIPEFMDEIAKQIRFGMGGRYQRSDSRRADHPVLDEIRDANFASQRKLAEKAAAQLGSTGTGNHYVDIFADEQDRIWIGVHFGSRGFGHVTATGFLAMAQGMPFDEQERKEKGLKPKDKGDEPTLLAIDSEMGQSYIEAMNLAGRYAYAGRDIVCEKVLAILGATSEYEVHNHHNFAWREEHDGRDLWVIRKGCTPAYPGQAGFVGATMGEESVILEGNPLGGKLDSTTRTKMEAALYSTVHGAGRVMSRTAAKGKFKMRKRYECCDRDCTRIFEIDGINPQNPPPKKGVCPDHPEARVRKVKVKEMVIGRDGKPRVGRIDWQAEQATLAASKIELRGGAADEAPGAYKRLQNVLAAQGDTIVVKHRLRPLGVAMAPSDDGERPDD